MHKPSLWIPAFIFLRASNAYSAITFSPLPTISTCEPVAVRWQGGTPPYILMIYPIGAKTVNDSLGWWNEVQGNAVTWIVNIAAGRTAFFEISDNSTAQNMGISSNFTVQPGDTNCLYASASKSSSSLTSAPTQLTPSSASTSSTSSTGLPTGISDLASNHASRNMPAGKVVGIVIGTLVGVLLLLVFPILYLWRRYRKDWVFMDKEARIDSPFTSPLLSQGLSPFNHYSESEHHSDSSHHAYTTVPTPFTDIDSVRTARQQEIQRSLRLAEKEIRELTLEARKASGEVDRSNRRPGGVRQQSNGPGNEMTMTEVKEQLRMLTGHIANLNAQLRSPWAQGVSNEPPPQYTTSLHRTTLLPTST